MMKRFSIVAILMALTVFSVFAFQFSPMEQTFESSGANAQKTYTIVNDSDEDIANSVSLLSIRLTLLSTTQMRILPLNFQL